MYKYFLTTLTALLLTCISMLAHADTANTDLGKLLSGVQTMQANFTQTVYDNRGKTIQKSYGHMSMERPGKFRWEVTKPIPQLIIANGSKLWIYDPDLEQVTIRSLKKSAGDAPALLLSHVNTTIEKDYAVKQLTNADVNKQSFSLIPKQADNMFERVKMSFANGQISEMDLVDHLGHTTHIQFKDIHSNLKLASSLFVFKAAANIDVIDETKAG